MKEKGKLKEIRVFVTPPMNEWLEELVDQGEIGNTKSEVVRTLLSDIKRGLIK